MPAERKPWGAEGTFFDPIASSVYDEYLVGPSSRPVRTRCHPSGWLQASALTYCLISLVGVKWSCLRIDKKLSPLFCFTVSHSAGDEHGDGPSRCRANSAKIRQSRPDYGLRLSHFQHESLWERRLFPPRSTAVGDSDGSLILHSSKIVKDKLTDLWGSWLLQNDFKITSGEITSGQLIQFILDAEQY